MTGLSDLPTINFIMCLLDRRKMTPYLKTRKFGKNYTENERAVKLIRMEVRKYALNWGDNLLSIIIILAIVVFVIVRLPYQAILAQLGPTSLINCSIWGKTLFIYFLPCQLKNRRNKETDRPTPTHSESSLTLPIGRNTRTSKNATFFSGYCEKNRKFFKLSPFDILSVANKTVLAVYE